MIRAAILIVSAVWGHNVPAQEAPLTPRSLAAAMDMRPEGEDAERLAERVRIWFGREPLLKGPNPKVMEREVAWAIEAPDAKTDPKLAIELNSRKVRLRRIGTSAVYAATARLKNGEALAWHYEVDGKRIG